MAPAQAVSAKKISPLGWALLVFRLILMALLLLLCTPLHLLWRVLGLGRLWPRIFLSSISAIAGLHIKRIGKASKNTLLISNHVTWLDIPALAEASGSAFVAHDGLTEFPLLKWLCEMNDTVFVARHQRSSVTEQIEQVRAAMAEAGPVTLFPEGTTNDGTQLHPFKSSLLSAIVPLPEGMAVQPVLLAYHDVPNVSWVGEEPGLDNFKRILARFRPVKLDIHFLEPLSGDDLRDRKTVAAASEKAISRAMMNMPG